MTDDYDRHEKFDLARTGLKTNMKHYSNGSVNITSDPSGEGYAKAHRTSGGDRIQLFGHQKGSDGKTRFWMGLEPDEARRLAEHILQEVERAEADSE